MKIIEKRKEDLTNKVLRKHFADTQLTPDTIRKRETIKQNREAFLNELRTGNYKKGTIKSDDKGYPVIETPEDADGCCACAIMGKMFGVTENNKISLPKAAKALGIDNKQCGYIQREINDTPLSFPEMADRIDAEVFNKQQTE